jgi:hypothetical protein
MILPTLLLIGNPLSGQSLSENRSFIKSFPLHENTRLEIINKYGDIHISSWEKDSVNIMAEIEAFAPDQSKLEKMIDGIEIKMTGSASLIRAETEFEREITVLIESFREITKKLIEFESKMQINYFINVPDDVDILIRNQFGNISMENNTGTISVTLSNGNFKANSINRISELNLDFGEAEIASVRSASINSTFAKIIINQSENIVLNSTSSKYELAKPGNIELESRRDKFFIGNIDAINGISYFSDYKINNLAGNTDLDLKYGSFDAETVNNDFESIVIRSSSTDITAGFDPSASFKFEIRHLNSFVVIPDENIKFNKETINEARKEYLLTGIIGGKKPSGFLRINATRGNIYIR